MNTKKLKQKVLQLAFSGVLTGDDAGGWERCTLGEVAEIVGGGTPKTSVDEILG